MSRMRVPFSIYVRSSPWLASAGVCCSALLRLLCFSGGMVAPDKTPLPLSLSLSLDLANSIMRFHQKGDAMMSGFAFALLPRQGHSRRFKSQFSLRTSVHTKGSRLPRMLRPCANRGPCARVSTVLLYDWWQS